MKPLPECPLNHDFWVAYLSSNDKKSSQAGTGTNKHLVVLGLIWSYTYLPKINRILHWHTTITLFLNMSSRMHGANLSGISGITKILRLPTLPL